MIHFNEFWFINLSPLLMLIQCSSRFEQRMNISRKLITKLWKCAEYQTNAGALNVAGLWIIFRANFWIMSRFAAHVVWWRDERSHKLELRWELLRNVVIMSRELTRELKQRHNKHPQNCDYAHHRNNSLRLRGFALITFSWFLK